jgi:hypothetical protein
VTDATPSVSPTFRRRVAPALLLVVLAPVIAEFLLADFTIRNLALLLALMPLYGCGALLVREVARRAGRGWPTMIFLALAYALTEEAFLTQSLFNPNYVNQRLLDYGYLPALGTSLNWTFFVLSIHVVWSIATPIAIAEGVAGSRRTTPWLKGPGLALTVLLYLLGCASTAVFSLKQSPFVASGTQFTVSALLVVTVIALAFLLFNRLDGRGAPPVTPVAPPLVVVAGATLILSGAYMVAETFARARGFDPSLPLTFRLACEAAAAAMYATWAQRAGWTSRHYLAIAAATSFTYFLYGLNVLLSGHTNLGAPTNAADIVGHVVLGAAVCGLIFVGGARRTAASAPTVPRRTPGQPA